MEKKKNTLHNIELWHWSEIKTTHLNVKQFKPGEQNEHAAMLAKEVYMFKMSKDKEKKKSRRKITHTFTTDWILYFLIFIYLMIVLVLNISNYFELFFCCCTSCLMPSIYLTTSIILSTVYILYHKLLFIWFLSFIMKL